MGTAVTRWIAALAIATLMMGALLATAARAAPALWAVRDADSTIYIFGTMHVLKPGAAWRTDRFDRAFAESREVVLEVAGLDDPLAMMPMVRSHGLDPAGSLSAKLEPADRERLALAIATSGLPAATVERMRPWLAAAALAGAPIRRAGYDPRSGVEMLLTAEAIAAGKALVGLETPEQQMRFMADRPEAEQLDALRRTLIQLDDAQAKLDALNAAWLAGDQARLGAGVLAARGGRGAAFDEVIRTNRNRAWADAIKDKLAGAGVTLVAVGAGHLIGPDSLLDELAVRGVPVERLQ